MMAPFTDGIMYESDSPDDHLKNSNKNEEHNKKGTKKYNKIRYRINSDFESDTCNEYLEDLNKSDHMYS